MVSRRPPNLHFSLTATSEESITQVTGRRRRDGRRRRLVVARKRPRVSISMANKPHVWTNEETQHFLQASVELAEDRRLFRGKLRNHTFRAIRDLMVEKGSAELPIDVVGNKFKTFMSDWRKCNELKLRGGSNFNPETGVFDAPKEWWDRLRDKTMKKFRRGIPHMKELDIIYKHMEDAPLSSCNCRSSSIGYKSRNSLGYQGSETVSHSVPIPSYLSLLDELKDAGLSLTDDAVVTAIDVLRCPNIRCMYSSATSIDEKITLLLKLREQGTKR